MSLALSLGLLRPLSELKDDEKPIVAIKALPTRAADHKRGHFHVALILDCSGSMHGDRIASVKETLQLLIGALLHGDFLTIIQFSSQASNVVASIELNDNNRSDLLGRVNRLQANNNTNLEAALRLLRVNVESEQNKTIDTVFILTDGYVNQGITDAAGLSRILAQTGLIAAGVPVNTLGYGADHNIQLLRDIALRSRGTYTYADKEELLPTIVADIVSGLATEVGRNAKLTLPDGWKCMELGSNSDVSDNQYVIGRLIADKPQWVVLEGPTKKSIISSTPEKIQFNVKWKSGIDILFRSVTLAETEGVDALEVADQLNRARVARSLAEISEKLDAGETGKAKQSLDELRKALDGSAAKNGALSSKLVEQVDEMWVTVEQCEKAPPGQYVGPSMKAVASRAAQNAANLKVQHGFISKISSDELDGCVQFSNMEQQQAQASWLGKFNIMKMGRKK